MSDWRILEQLDRMNEHLRHIVRLLEHLVELEEAERSYPRSAAIGVMLQ